MLEKSHVSSHSCMGSHVCSEKCTFCIMEEADNSVEECKDLARHEGPHVHTTKEDVIHYCETRCHSCGFFCQLPIEDPGLHDTVHGNMRNAKFISEDEEIDIDDRKYAWML